MPKSNGSESRALMPDLPRRHWLEWAEYISLASSAIGSIVVALSNQAFYGVAPLTVALSLNVANRYRHEQEAVRTQAEVVEMRESVEQLEQKAVQAIVGVRKQLRGEMQTLREQLQTPGEGELAAARQSQQVAALTESVMSFQEQISRALDEIEGQFRQELIPLQDSLNELRNAIAQLKENAVAQTELQRAITDGEGEPGAVSPAAIADLCHLQAELDRISKENETVIKPHIKRLILMVKELQKTGVKPSLPRPPKPQSEPQN
ncbi:hypothetical protein [Lyngbya sp. CCY1209]|uniref:hypothetical protein n=1 Tax=Lyngbya sp. CCY1209 TaxID=2886103 RepID=UPI002D20E7E7|nr:hypothetical protein [Lyngbya sp. CCY1209]MEB3886575.1 hypothetical protein [Lyngbya sp. CCY1209]